MLRGGCVPCAISHTVVLELYSHSCCYLAHRVFTCNYDAPGHIDPVYDRKKDNREYFQSNFFCPKTKKKQQKTKKIKWVGYFSKDLKV